MYNKDEVDKLLNHTLREVLEEIEKMVGDPMWSQTFVAKCLLGFEQCLKVMDADYETSDMLTDPARMKGLPDVSFVTDSKIIKRFGQVAGGEALEEVD